MNAEPLLGASIPVARPYAYTRSSQHSDPWAVRTGSAGTTNTRSVDFRVGAAYAVEALGYDAAELARLPLICTRRFAGVGNPLSAGTVPAGAVVLDHGCGSGTDLLLALQRGGPQARAIGIDMTPVLRHVARRSAVEAGVADRMRVHPGSCAELPLADECIDLALSNGPLNLAYDKLQALRELHRVLRRGGALYLAVEVVPRSYAEWLSRNVALESPDTGAAPTEDWLIDALRVAGFAQVRVVARRRSCGEQPDCASISLRASKP